MNNIVDKIYVINMKKDVERLLRFKDHIGNLFNYVLVEGVDPVNNEKYSYKYEIWLNENRSTVNYENFNWEYYINRYHDLKISGINTKEKAWEHWTLYGEKELRSCNPNNDIVNKGQWGCLYSHINILKHAIKHNYKSILILEDDIVLTNNIHFKIDNLKTLINENSSWNIIYLGASQHNWDNIEFGQNLYYAKETTGTFAYMINSKFYETLLNEFVKMKKPVDNYLVQIQKIYYGSIYVLYPNIIICNLEESNIGKKRKNKDYYKKFRWDTILY